jgi:hypothetical protein
MAGPSVPPDLETRKKDEARIGALVLFSFEIRGVFA